MKNIARKPNNQKGIALLEFSLAMPLFILLLIIIFEGGRYFDAYFRMASIAWDGARFFSSLEEPEVRCFAENQKNPAEINTTNLAFRRYGPGDSDLNNQVYKTHLPVHQRIEAEFYIKNSSWPIISNDPTRDDLFDGKGPQTVFARLNAAMPTIKTQYVGSLSGASGGLPSNAADVCASLPPIELENTLGVCLYSTYKGLFLDLPIKSCSYSYLLEKATSAFASP